MNRSAQPLPSGARTKAGELGATKIRSHLDAEEAQLSLEHVGHVLAAVVMADGEAAGCVFGKRAKAAAHALTDRLQRLEAHRAHGAMPLRTA